MKTIFSNTYVHYGLLVFAGLFLGWLLFHSPKAEKDEHNHSAAETIGEIWTCSMDPQVRKDAAGKCPICGMDLIQLKQSNEAKADSNAVHFSKEAAQLANVSTSIVSRQKPTKEGRMYGKV